MLLAFIMLFVLMLVCATVLYCKSPTFEHFTDEPQEKQVIDVYERILQRQPSAKELTDMMLKLKSTEVTLQDIEGRLMDTDEYGRIIKLQSNTLTPELDKIIHERKQLAYIAEVYFEEMTNNVDAKLLMPLRDIYIYLDYQESALRILFREPKYPDFEKQLSNAFQLTKEQTIRMFDEMFKRSEIMDKAKGLVARDVQTEIVDPPKVTPKFDTVSDQSPNNQPVSALVAKNTTTQPATPTTTTSSPQSTAVIPGKSEVKESFANYQAYTSAPVGAPLGSVVARTVRDEDSNSRHIFFDIEQRSKEIFDIHKVASALDGTPDAFVYLPSIPVRYEKPATHYTQTPDNIDPFVTDLYGAMKCAPAPI